MPTNVLIHKMMRGARKRVKSELHPISLKEVEDVEVVKGRNVVVVVVAKASRVPSEVSGLLVAMVPTLQVLIKDLNSSMVNC